ncbi:hypothetical protein GCM10010195_66900 [Kitasatospora griseola]|nr:hypothetical protein GCM10010195_66900 [Kitasatospora griseola]
MWVVRSGNPAVGYGVTIDAVDGWRLFVACIGTARRARNCATAGTSTPTTPCRRRRASRTARAGAGDVYWGTTGGGLLPAADSGWN